MDKKGIFILALLAIVISLGYILDSQEGDAHSMVAELNLPADEFDSVTSLSELDQNEQFMYEHCLYMSEMQGCEPYNKLAERLEEQPNQFESTIGADFLPGQSRAASELTPVQSSTIVDIADGETYTMTADIITKKINGEELIMYGYNGMIPGPALRVRQDSTIKVVFTNNIDLPTTVHWHGLRHDLANDGVPDVSQPPMQPGDTFEYELYFPDDGIFWYHPHIREDIQQDAGMAGNMLVIPVEAYNPVNREELIVLDDLLLGDDGSIVPFGGEHANFAVMGRFGNVMLVNGDVDHRQTANEGEVVRYYITNVANVRPYKLSIPGAQMKLVGGDLGQYETETLIDELIIAPAERYIVDVYFADAGTYTLLNVNPHKSYVLSTITVEETTEIDDYSEQFFNDLTNPTIRADINDFAPYFDKAVDYELNLNVDLTDFMDAMATLPCHEMGGIVMGDCTEEERVALEAEAEEHEERIEWEDEMNMRAPGDQVTWEILDTASGATNMDISMTASIGDIVKIRLFNDPESMHPMQHPIHLHGQRFIITHIDGEPVDNKVWKDTVLVPIGSTVDILVDVTNPGEWMMHCHIAEHLEAGMMTSFTVA